ncbi:MAG: hypothetical protein PHT02_15010 [Tissierellia bacterium]|nr:hypothetical protein [Tissierellia bacterium]
MKIYFSDYFNVTPEKLAEYGAFNISLINDMPLFIDPFLLFGSKNPVYKKLHNEIIKYLSFLKLKSTEGINDPGKIRAWYKFSEVKQNWLGYSQIGNSGRGLGMNFGESMSNSMHIVFDDLGKETITQSSHLEKVGLFDIGVGKDSISDFTTNLIKDYLLTYTQAFAKENIETNLLKEVKIEKVYFDYDLESWMPKTFVLPYMSDYVILTPRDLLTKDDTWINGDDLRGNFLNICKSVQNEELRFKLNNYFQARLPRYPEGKKPSRADYINAVQATIKMFPEIIKWYIKEKEEDKEGAKSISEQKVFETESFFIHQVSWFVKSLLEKTEFYTVKPNGSYEESLNRINYLKDFIENNDGYKMFYFDGKPIKRESDLQIVYRLTWYASEFDVNREVNNGRGPADYVVSKGSNDKTVVEFKLASNSKIEQNLVNQVEIYKKANNTSNSIKAILYFDESEFQRVDSILKKLGLDDDPSVVLIDASPKLSASNVR